MVLGATSELSWCLLMVILWLKVALGMAFLSLKKRRKCYSGATMQRNDQKYVIFSKKVQKTINFGTFW